MDTDSASVSTPPHSVNRSVFGAVVLILVVFLLTAAGQPLFGREGGPSFGTKDIRPDVDVLKGIDLIYQRQFDDAESVFKKIIAGRPDESAGHFYLAMVSWSRLAAGFWDPGTVEIFEKRIDRVIEVAKGQIDNNRADIYDFFYLGGALGFKGRFELMKDNWVSSFFLAKDAVDSLKVCVNMDPDNKDVLFGIGTFDYYTARFSGVKKFLTYLFLHEGDKEEGLRKLTIASTEAVYSATEAKSMLLHIYLFFEQEFSKARELAVQLSDKYARNPRFKVLEGVAYIRLGMDSHYAKTVSELLRRGVEETRKEDADIWNRQALYLECAHELFKGRCSQARTLLQKILDHPDPKNDPAMIAWPLLKTGMSYDLENERDKAVSYYEKVLDMENGAGAQVLAEKFMESPPAKGNSFLGY